jgi:hypothetical protein
MKDKIKLTEEDIEFTDIKSPPILSSVIISSINKGYSAHDIKQQILENQEFRELHEKPDCMYIYRNDIKKLQKKVEKYDEIKGKLDDDLVQDLYMSCVRLKQENKILKQRIDDLIYGGDMD